MTQRIFQSRRPIYTLAFIILLLLPLPFMPEYGANTTSRLMLVTAMAVEGSTRIDRHAELTVDKALHSGHYYSDKAPGMALLALPAYMAGRAILLGLGLELDLLAPRAEKRPFKASEMMTLRAIVLTSGGLLMALAGVSFLWMAWSLTGSAKVATLAMATVFLATPYLGWSVQFFGHAAAGACLFLAFALSHSLAARNEKWVLRSIAAGVALGMAVSIEYTAAPVAVMIACYAAWSMRRKRAVMVAKVFGVAILAALVAVLPMLVYHQVSFGSPFKVGYSNVVGFEGMQQGFLGLTIPDPAAFWGITFGFQRGLFWLAPVIVLVPLGAWGAWNARHWRAEIALCLSVIAYYFLLNASYYYWQGGSSVGPRHVMPAVPFMGIPLLWLWWTSQGRLRTSLNGLVILGFIFALACGLTTMSVHLGYRLPLKDPILEGFFSEINVFRRWDEMGVPGGLLLLVWGAANMLLVRALWRRIVAYDLRAQAEASDRSTGPQSSRRETPPDASPRQAGRPSPTRGPD